jgi:RimJ/RimL family protein N-acetyltransferase
VTTGPVLFTERLVLRLPEPLDFDGWADMAADAEAMQFLGGAKGRAEAWRDFALRRGAWDVRGFSMFSVIERATGAWVGRIGPWQPEEWPGTEVGWGVHPAFAGRGYAYEAATACMDFAVDVLGWDDIIHTIDPANTRSIALARRLGSVDRGPVRLPAPLSDFTVNAWGQSAADWRARRRT